MKRTSGSLGQHDGVGAISLTVISKKRKDMHSYLSTLILKARERLIIHRIVETVMEIKCFKAKGYG